MGMGANGVEEYQYDTANRLSQRKIGANAWETVATYDGVGNIKTKLNVGGAYAYNSALRPHAVTSVGSYSYTYDANGSVLTRNFNNGTVNNQLTIEWYDFNQPKEFYWYRPTEGGTAKSVTKK